MQAGYVARVRNITSICIGSPHNRSEAEIDLPGVRGCEMVSSPEEAFNRVSNCGGVKTRFGDSTALNFFEAVPRRSAWMGEVTSRFGAKCKPVRRLQSWLFRE